MTINFTKPFQGACSQYVFDGKRYVIDEHGANGSYWYDVIMTDDREPHEKTFKNRDDAIAYLGQNVKVKRYDRDAMRDAYGIDWIMTRERNGSVTLKEVKKCFVLTGAFYSYSEALQEAKAIVKEEMKKKGSEQLTIFDY